MDKRKNYSFIIGLIIVIGMVLFLVIQQYQYSVISEDKLNEVTENYSSYRKSKYNKRKEYKICRYSNRNKR